jgi:transcriptional regulator with XRE-family HTH domain
MAAVAKAPDLARHEDNQALRDQFGARLGQLMRRAGFRTHRALAEKTGIDRSLLTRLINGERRANGDQVSRLAAALNVKPAELWTQPHSEGPESKPPGLDDQPRQTGSNDPNVDPTTGGVGSVTTDQGRIVGRMLDKIEDEDERNAAMRACLDVLAHPHGLGAEQRRDRVRRSK